MSAHGAHALRAVADAFLEVLEASTERRRDALEALDPAIRSEVVALVDAATPASDALEHPSWAIDDADRGLVSLPPGTRAGQFTIVSEIGRGGMGVVYRATQDNPARDVALKVLALPFPSSAAIARFRREAAALARLRHPGVATIFDSGTIDGPSGAIPFFAMEFVEGQSITRYAESMGLDRDHRIDLLTQVCEAVQHAHQKGVIHRDLKPANILVDKEGRARVLDFGIAKVLEADGGEPGVTLESGRVPGTPAYMSPEQLNGGDVDTRSDVYSLGVLAYEVLANRQPFAVGARPSGDLTHTLRQRSPSRLGALDPRLRGDAEAIVAKAMEPLPERRYRAAGEIADDFRRMRAGRPIHATPPSTWENVRKFVARNRALSATAAFAALAVLVGVPLVAWQGVRASRAEARAVQRADDLRQLTRALTDLSDSLAPFSGSMARREQLLLRIAPLLHKLALEPDKSDALRLDLAAGLVSLARMQGMPGYPNQGRMEESTHSYASAISLLEEAYRDGRGPAESWNPLQHACMEVSEEHRVLEQVGPAEARLGRAIEVTLAHTIADQHDILGWQTLAGLMNHRAVQLLQWGQEPQKAAHRADIRRVADRLDRFEARDPVAAATIGGGFLGLGTALLRIEDPVGALSLLSSSEAWLRKSLDSQPRETNNRLTLGDVHRYRAQAWRQASSDPLPVIQSLEAASDEYRRVLDAEPARADAGDILARTLLELARARAGAREHERAVADTREAITIVENFAQADPSDMRIRGTLIEHCGTAFVLLERVVSDASSQGATRDQASATARQCAIRATQLAGTMRSPPISPELLERLVVAAR